MGITVIFCVLLILPGERVLIRGQTAIGGGNGSDCCPFVAVNEGTIAGLDGSYSLKENQGSKPEDVCINGCVYTKDGTPASDEYCFRQDAVKRANVMCPANTTPYGTTQPKTAGPTTPAGTTQEKTTGSTTPTQTTSTTTAASAKSEADATASEISSSAAELTSLLDSVTDETLKSSLTSLVTSLDSLSSTFSSLGSLLGSSRVKRATDCDSISNIIAKYQSIKIILDTAISDITTIFTKYPDLETTLKPVFDKITGIKSSLVTKLSSVETQISSYQNTLNQDCATTTSKTFSAKTTQQTTTEPTVPDGTMQPTTTGPTASDGTIQPETTGPDGTITTATTTKLYTLTTTSGTVVTGSSRK